MACGAICTLCMSHCPPSPPPEPSTHTKESRWGRAAQACAQLRGYMLSVLCRTQCHLAHGTRWHLCPVEKQVAPGFALKGSLELSGLGPSPSTFSPCLASPPPSGRHSTLGERLGGRIAMVGRGVCSMRERGQNLALERLSGLFCKYTTPPHPTPPCPPVVFQRSFHTGTFGGDREARVRHGGGVEHEMYHPVNI